MILFVYLKVDILKIDKQIKCNCTHAVSSDDTKEIICNKSE